MSAPSTEILLMSKYEQYRELYEDSYSVGVMDDDGANLYEEPYGSLLNAIVQYNDTSKLTRYLANNPSATNGHCEVHYWDPFYIAAEWGSTEALSLLFEHYNAHLTDTAMIPLENRQFKPLNVACLNARVDTALFLLDTQPALANLHANDNQPILHRGRRTPLLCAACSFTYGHKEEDLAINDQLARAEELMNNLLDRGASARDFLTSPLDNLHISDTVLTLAISRASYCLVKGLIQEGADMHAQICREFDSLFGQSIETVQGITVLHLASLHANIDGIQALFDHRGDKVTLSEMVFSTDSAGHLPLHWAARGAHGPEFCYMLPHNKIVTHMLDTITLLLRVDKGTINVRDHHGYNALWYAAVGFRNNMDQYRDVLKILLANGADAMVRNQQGQDVLHLLGSTQGGKAIDSEIIQSLVACGANIQDVDIHGNTPLSQMAINLRQVIAVKALLECGASMSLKNFRGDTPLHRAANGRVFHLEYEPHIVPLDAKIQAQDEMMKILEEADDGLGLMEEKNMDGKTPRQLLGETRRCWVQEEQAKLSQIT